MADEVRNLLHSAIETDDVDGVRDWLEAGYSVREAGRDGLTAIASAAKHRRDEILELLISYFKILRRFPPSTLDLDALFIAIETANVEFLVRWTSNGLDFNVQDSEGNSPLHHCALANWNCKTIIVTKWLLEDDAEPKVKNNEGHTPLHFAVFDYQESADSLAVVKAVISLLISAGADINAQDNLGRTPLHVAKYSWNFNCFFDLLRFGADVNIEDNNGKTVLDYIFDNLSKQNCLINLKDFREPSQYEWKVYGSTKELLQHVIAKGIIDLREDTKIYQRLIDLHDWTSFMEMHDLKEVKEIPDRDPFIEGCEKEMIELDQKKLDGFRSMLVFLRMNKRETAHFVKNPTVIEYFKSEKYIGDFPIYWYLLEFKYNEGLVRNIVMPLARDALHSLNLPLPEVVNECILNQFTNRELINFIEAVIPSDPQLYERFVPLRAIFQREITNTVFVG